MEDSEAAWRWYEKAAASGDPVGQYYFGCSVFHEYDRKEGVEWIRQAAEQGYAPALYREGLLRESGDVLERDLERARRCMLRAAELGHPLAARWLAFRGLGGRDGVAGFFRALRWFLSVGHLALRIEADDSMDQNMLSE